METKELNLNLEREGVVLYACSCFVPGDERYFRSEALLWGSVLVLVGGILLLNTLGLLPAVAPRLIWPGLLLTLGVNALWRVIRLN